MAAVFLIIGIVCLVYCLAILVSGVYGSWFFLTWGAAGIALIILAWFLHAGFWTMLPVLVRKTAVIFCLLGLALFLLVEGLIISGFHQKGKEDLDYLIVLGAQIWPSGPSKALQYRLDAACDYLMENPDTIVIVSGGKGYNEPCTEAQGMFDYLVGRGIPAERILQEDKSTNTHQNLKFSSALMESKSCSVGIVTNNFHIFRSIGLARKQGFTNVCGISAPSNSFFQPNNMLREFFGVMKDWMAGNL